MQINDNDIIKALNGADGLEHISLYCADNNGKDVTPIKIVDIIDLINRQKAEIEELKSDIAILKHSNINLQELYHTEKEKVAQAKQKVIDACKMLKIARADTITEFENKVGKCKYPNPMSMKGEIIYGEDFDQIAKEMKGEQK